jgi:P63C domain
MLEPFLLRGCLQTIHVSGKHKASIDKLRCLLYACLVNKEILLNPNVSETRASKGGRARAETLAPKERSEIASRAAVARWAKKRQGEIDQSTAVVKSTSRHVQKMPVARYRGMVTLMGMEIPCYVLDTNQRVIGRTSSTEILTGITGGGDLEKYLGVSQFRDFINLDEVIERMISFHLPGVEGLNREAKGLPADLFIDICRNLVSALEASNSPDSKMKLTERQTFMAIKASIFLGAVAKVGFDALIDEATGYQKDREVNALAVKLNLYLSEELRKWEKTFPDELWIEFGRLTSWKGSVKQRPKFWGKLVNELVYGYLDENVYRWLKENAPRPAETGIAYHRWLSEQYGLKRLIEHIYKVIGVAQTCRTMPALRAKMAEIYGTSPAQALLFPREVMEDLK